MPDVQQLHEESVTNLGKGTRKELGTVRRDDFRKPKDEAK